MDQTTETLLRAIGASYNQLDTAPLQPHLGDDTEWHSQNVFEVLRGASAILDYLNGKFATLAECPPSILPLFVLAELPWGTGCDGPCLSAFQSEDETPNQIPVALILIEHDEHGTLKKISMCSVAPNPAQARITDDCPGLTPEEGSRRLRRLFPNRDDGT